MFFSRRRYYGYWPRDDMCGDVTWGVWTATGTDSNLPARTDITTFLDGRFDTVRAPAILVAWQATDKAVLAALAERGEDDIF